MRKSFHFDFLLERGYFALTKARLQCHSSPPSSPVVKNQLLKLLLPVYPFPPPSCCCLFFSTLVFLHSRRLILTSTGVYGQSNFFTQAYRVPQFWTPKSNPRLFDEEVVDPPGSLLLYPSSRFWWECSLGKALKGRISGGMTVRGSTYTLKVFSPPSIQKPVPFFLSNFILQFVVFWAVWPLKSLRLGALPEEACFVQYLSILHVMVSIFVHDDTIGLFGVWCTFLHCLWQIPWIRLRV